MRNVVVIIMVLLGLFSCHVSELLVGELGNPILSVEVPSDAHFRGIQSVNDKIVWLSGTRGTVLRTENGGRKWKDITVPNCEHLDFRDIHALDENKAWVLSSGNGVTIYHTIDGGKNWELQFEDSLKSVFFDGMDFSSPDHGVAFGDPINGVMDILITNDGKNWKRVASENIPLAWEDEAGFAASGTGIVNQGRNVWIATGGGEISRIIKSDDFGETWRAIQTPIIGGNGAGVFSMAFKDELTGVIVGGDYVDSTRVSYNCAFTLDGGETWSLVETNGPKGYRSCVAFTAKGDAIACGRTGVDLSIDLKNWSSLSNEGYFTCDAADNYVWFAGRRGKVGKLELK